MSQRFSSGEATSASGLTIDEMAASLPGVPAAVATTLESAAAVSANGRPSLKGLVVRGSAWTLVGHGSGQFLRLISNLILTRLLFPQAFGVMALVNVVINGLTMFSDVGIGPSVIQHKRGDDAGFYNTAWTIQVVRGFLLWLCACVLAWPVAAFYGEPQLVQLIPVAGVTALLAGFNSTKLFTANRHLAIGRLSLVDLVAQFVGVLFMIGCAWVWPSVWALALGGVVATAAKLVLSHLLLEGERNRLHWDRAAFRELAHFGKWVFISTLLTFLAMNSDRAMLGKFLSFDMLGVYSIGFVLAMAGAEIVNKLTRIVLLPALAGEARVSTAKFESSLARGRQLVFTAAGVVTAATLLLAPAFFRGLFDHRYQDAAWIAQLLCIGAWFTMLQRTVNMGILALGSSRSVAASQAVNFLVTIVAAPTGFYLFGLAGFICGWNLGNLAGLISIETTLTRRGIHLWGQDVAYSVWMALSIMAGLILQSLARNWLPTTTSNWLADLAAVSLLAALAAPFLIRHVTSIASERGK